jgi:hypothetical protein
MHVRFFYGLQAVYIQQLEAEIATLGAEQHFDPPPKRSLC